jgi:carbamoyltransferase
MKILGINALNHDAAMTVIEDGEILWSAHSERYSRIKNDGHLNQDIVDEALSFGQPDIIAYYERPWLKKTRQAYAGQWGEVFRLDNLPSVHLAQFGICGPIQYVDHHHSHAAAGYYTSKFEKAAVLVLDGIGEWDTATIWKGDGNSLVKLTSMRYPKSFGLFYSAFTHLLGLKPNEEEYIMMGMAAYGNPNRYHLDVLSYKDKNMHRGVQNWPHAITCDQDKFDIAAAVQQVYEAGFKKFLEATKNLTNCKNLVFMGGCALNCLANRLIGEYFENIWIMPNPGDAGSSLGAAAVVYGRHLNWRGPYLGTCIPGAYPVDNIVDELLARQIVGVASGHAECGPRALGNRSLLGDPRGIHIKEKVNAIKQRQQFRPFAPVILAEVADNYFDMPAGWHHSPYMQSVARCRQPSLTPAICHVDGTSRVQTVAQDGSGIRQVLEKWYELTGCPMLLNTSLNIKGQPIVNTKQDAIDFERLYNVKVCS